MRLPQPFYRLPVRFDAERLQAELEALPASAWAVHPDRLRGQRLLRLISVERRRERQSARRDEADAPSAGVSLRPPGAREFRRGLEPFALHAHRPTLVRAGARGHGYQWFYRVRMHIPVITWPEVRFYCGDEDVHMAAGEVWLFDNWRRHRVENPTDHARVHLVADTSGTSTFWQFVGQQRAPEPTSSCRTGPRSIRPCRPNARCRARSCHRRKSSC